MTPEAPVQEPAKRTKRTREQIEREWFDVFERWPAADRAAAIKALTVVDRSLRRRGDGAVQEEAE